MKETQAKQRHLLLMSIKYSSQSITIKDRTEMAVLPEKGGCQKIVKADQEESIANIL